MVEAINKIMTREGMTFTSVVLELLRKELYFEGASPSMGRDLDTGASQAYDKASGQDSP
jgi:hypothetical protein